MSENLITHDNAIQNLRKFLHADERPDLTDPKVLKEFFKLIDASVEAGIREGKHA